MTTHQRRHSSHDRLGDFAPTLANTKRRCSRRMPGIESSRGDGDSDAPLVWRRAGFLAIVQGALIRRQGRDGRTSRMVSAKTSQPPFRHHPPEGPRQHRCPPGQSRGWRQARCLMRHAEREEHFQGSLPVSRGSRPHGRRRSSSGGSGRCPCPTEARCRGSTRGERCTAVLLPPARRSPPVGPPPVPLCGEAVLRSLTGHASSELLGRHHPHRLANPRVLQLIPCCLPHAPAEACGAV